MQLPSSYLNEILQHLFVNAKGYQSQNRIEVWFLNSVYRVELYENLILDCLGLTFAHTSKLP